MKTILGYLTLALLGIALALILSLDLAHIGGFS